MAKLVKGTNKQNGVPAIVRDMSPAHYVEYPVNSNGVMSRPTKLMSFAGVTEIQSNVLQNLYYGNRNVSGHLDMSSVTTLGGHSCNSAFYQTSVDSADLSNVTLVDIYACNRMFYNAWIKSLDMSKVTTLSAYSFDNICYMASLQTLNLHSLTTINGRNAMYNAFQKCSSLTTVDISSLQTISEPSAFQDTFHDCTSLTTIDLSKLEIVSGQSACTAAFMGDTALIEIKLDSLRSISGSSSPFGQFLRGCTHLPTLRFPSLNSIAASSVLARCCSGCTALETVWFYALNSNSFGSYTNQFLALLESVTGCTVHFPMAIQSIIESWADVTAGFGGTNTTVLFDIVTTLTGADTNSYTRSEKDSTTTATAWKYNDTLYYTSGISNHTAGVNEPTVGVTIYSDAACTTAVTTVTAIA